MIHFDTSLTDLDLQSRLQQCEKAKNFCSNYLATVSIDKDGIWYTFGSCWPDLLPTGSAFIAGGVKMKLFAIWFCGNRSMAKGASEDRLAHLSVCLRRTSGSPQTARQQRWMTGLAGERKPLGEGGRLRST